MVSTPDRDTILNTLSLGKSTTYSETYDATLLQGVPRSLNRNDIQLSGELPFSGVDRWNGYELSWLNNRGKPHIAILQCEIPATSTHLIESKSFKLYLNSFNQTTFSSVEEVKATITADLSRCAHADVAVAIIEANQFSALTMDTLDARCIDDLDIEVSDYHLKPHILCTLPTLVEECLSSNLLKSNCLITNQPDWGSVLIKYKGQKIDHESLLRYLISFRQHNEFHEQCVERIFCDLMHYCQPELLTVYARYTRRGGLDINPFRSNFETIYPEFRLARQ